MATIPFRTVLGVARLVVGVGSWLAPDHAVRFFGIQPVRADRFIARLFGARDAALAAALLAAPPGALGAVATVGAGIDLIDAVAGFQEGARGTLSRRALVLGPGGAVLFAALGGLVLRQKATTVAA